MCPHLTFTNNWKKGKEGFNNFLLWQRVNPDIKLIIVDTLQMIRESVNSNTYESDYEEISKLKKISDMIDVPIIVLHHTRKQASNDPLFEVSGTLGITGAADTTLRLKRSRRHSTAELFITSRDIEEKEYALKFSEYIGWELLGDADDYRQTSERQEILDIIKNADEPISPKEIAEILDKNPDTVRGLIKRIKDEGHIISPAYGKYIYNTGNNINSINSVNGLQDYIFYILSYLTLYFYINA